MSRFRECRDYGGSRYYSRPTYGASQDMDYDPQGPVIPTPEQMGTWWEEGICALPRDSTPPVQTPQYPYQPYNQPYGQHLPPPHSSYYGSPYPQPAAYGSPPPPSEGRGSYASSLTGSVRNMLNFNR
ncbi:hypothetical protein H0H87_003449 [Tephrocybe sp. NHM501043]|nr:hypothetical protein H0H87_003449 [Tephrocybe sp. NHM501043]